MQSSNRYDFGIVKNKVQGWVNHGYSSMPKEGKEFLHANDLLTLLDSLKIKKVHVVGLSMGGFIATDFLALHPERLLSVTLASGDVFPVPEPSEPWTEEQLKKRRKQIQELKKNDIIKQKWNWLEGLMSNGGTNLENIRKPDWNMIYKWS